MQYWGIIFNQTNTNDPFYLEAPFGKLKVAVKLKANMKWSQTFNAGMTRSKTAAEDADLIPKT